MTAEEALRSILRIAKEEGWEKYEAITPTGKVWALAHIALKGVDTISFHCELDEMQCSEQCHGNLERKKQCSFCTVLST